MGRALTAWERAQREYEKNSAREAAANFRAHQRELARREREREREAQRVAREVDRENRRRAREAEEQAKLADRQASIASCKQEVMEAEAFLAGLTSLHARPFDPRRLEAQFRQRRARRPLPPAPFVPATFPERFEPTPFARTRYSERDFSVSPLGSVGRRREGVGMLVGGAGVLMLGLGAVWFNTARDSHSGTFVPILACLAGVAGIIGGASLIASVKKLRLQHARDEEAAKARHEAAEDLRASQHREATELARRAFESRRHDFSEQDRLRMEASHKADREAQAAWDEGEDERIEVLERASAGNVTAIEMICEALLPLKFGLKSPWDSITSIADHEVAYRVLTGKAVQLVTHLPALDLVPDRTATMNAAGDRIKYEKLKKSDRVNLYDSFVASFTLHHAMAVFEACPSLEVVEVESCLVEPDRATGEDLERVLLRAKYERNHLASLKMERVDAKAILESLDHEACSIAEPASDVQRMIPRSAVTWATPTNDGLEVPPGLIDLAEGRRLPNPFATPSERGGNHSGS